jgi:uncharacterized membrane protein (Fun14 family)
MDIDDFSSITLSLGGGFFVGVLLGYALKKVIKIAAIIVGLFIAGIAYLQSQQLATINWDKLEQLSVEAIITFANATTTTIIDSSSSNNDNNGIIFAITNFSGIPLASSISAGFTIGFLKG